MALTPQSGKMLNKAAVFTRPASARQDALFRRQGRSERSGVRFGALNL
jgi:hypothetical protein